MKISMSNNLIGILNVLTLVLSIPILVAGVWPSEQAGSDCERFLQKSMIGLGAILVAVSIAGIVGACCRVTWLMWAYLIAMFLLIVVLSGLTVFAFVVTDKGAGEALSGKGYREYRLGDYSNWLQKRVAADKNWSKIRDCLVASKVCSRLSTDDKFNSRHLSSFQSRCCKPTNDCNFTYVKPTNWNENYMNSDCNKWDNNSATLCFDCESCKAGVVDSIKSLWKRVAVVNVIVLVFLIIVYSIGCCAFRNNRKDNSWKQPYP